MNRNFLKLILLSLIIIFGSELFVSSANAGGKLILEATKECNIQYSGDSCIAELKLTNNTNEILDGEAVLNIDYQGICGDGFFDEEGIEAQFSIDNTNWLDFSDWENGSAKVSSFEIVKGESWPKLKIETSSSLCPGKYTFTLTLKGTTGETGEEYRTSPIAIGGGGASSELIIKNEEEADVGDTWAEEYNGEEINDNDDGKVFGASDNYQNIPDNNSATVSYPRRIAQKTDDFVRKFVNSFSTKDNQDKGEVKGEKDKIINEKNAGEKSTEEEVFEEKSSSKIWWLILLLLFLIVAGIVYHYRKNFLFIIKRKQ